jgi:hypothetical protein
MRRIALVAAMLLVLAACGDDDGGLSLEDYYSQLETAGAAYDEAAQVVDTGLDQTTDPLTDVKELLPAFESDLDEFVATLDGIDAPDKAAEAHAQAVDAGKAAAAAYDEVLAGLDDIDDLTGLLTFFEGPEFAAFGEAGDRFTESCEALQAVADEEGIDVDLRCD